MQPLAPLKKTKMLVFWRGGIFCKAKGAHILVYSVYSHDSHHESLTPVTLSKCSCHADCLSWIVLSVSLVTAPPIHTEPSPPSSEALDLDLVSLQAAAGTRVLLPHHRFISYWEESDSNHCSAVCPLMPSHRFFSESSEGQTNRPAKPRERALPQLCLQQHGAGVAELRRSCRRGRVSAALAGTRRLGLGFLLLFRLPGGSLSIPCQSLWELCLSQQWVLSLGCVWQTGPQHHLQPIPSPCEDGWKICLRQLVCAQLCAGAVLLSTKGS